MANQDPILEEFKKLVGKEMEPEVWEAGTEHIKWFAQAIGDPNPLWQDMAYAEKSRYKKVIGPPMFLIDVGLVKLVDRLVDMAPAQGQHQRGHRDRILQAYRGRRYDHHGGQSWQRFRRRKARPVP